MCFLNRKNYQIKNIEKHKKVIVITFHSVSVCTVFFTNSRYVVVYIIFINAFFLYLLFCFALLCFWGVPNMLSEP